MDHNITDKKFQDHLDWAAGLQRGSKIRLGHLHGDIEQPCEYTYNIGNLKGFSGTFDSEAYKEIKAHGSFVHIEPNTVVTPCGKSETPPADFVHVSSSTCSQDFDSVGIANFVLRTPRAPLYGGLGPSLIARGTVLMCMFMMSLPAKV